VKPKRASNVGAGRMCLPGGNGYSDFRAITGLVLKTPSLRAKVRV